MGNHETMMRLALDLQTPWGEALDCARNVDRQRRRSDGCGVCRGRQGARDLDGLLAAARASLPQRVRAWPSLRASWHSGDILFVHAGVNPRVKLDAFLAVPWNTPLSRLVEERHWAWVRWPFLEYRPGRKGFSGLFVVHGHTPNDAQA